MLREVNLPAGNYTVEVIPPVGFWQHHSHHYHPDPG